MAFNLLLPRQFANEIVQQAQAELPNECCGLLAGQIAASLGKVSRRYPLVNSAASPTEYLSEPKSMFAAVKAMRGEGLEILAIYHSHPSSAPIPSLTDLQRSYSSDVVNLIVSLRATAPELRGWWLQGEAFVEAAITLVD